MIVAVSAAAGLAEAATDSSQDAARASLAMRKVLLEFQHAIGGLSCFRTSKFQAVEWL